MSAKSEFSTRVENATTNSSYGEGFGDSDDEDASSESSVFEGIPKDYWFGTKYFEYVIAQELLRHTRPYENVAVIDVSFIYLTHGHVYLRTLSLNWQLRSDTFLLQKP